MVPARQAAARRARATSRLARVRAAGRLDRVDVGLAGAALVGLAALGRLLAAQELAGHDGVAHGVSSAGTSAAGSDAAAGPPDAVPAVTLARCPPARAERVVSGRQAGHPQVPSEFAGATKVAFGRASYNFEKWKEEDMINPGSVGDWLQALLMAAAGGMAATCRWALRAEEAQVSSRRPGASAPTDAPVEPAPDPQRLPAGQLELARSSSRTSRS